MQKFMDDTFMLYNETGRRLYESCREIPIFDYHCHLSAKEIYENKKPSNLTELWLSGDHYKWRIMRAHGIEEEMIMKNSMLTPERCRRRWATLCSTGPIWNYSGIFISRMC